MVSVQLPGREVQALIERWPGLSVAAFNGPGSVVVSGEVGLLDEFLAVCEERGVRARRVAVDYASHSVQVDELRVEILEALEPIRPEEGGVPFFSAVAGRGGFG